MQTLKLHITIFLGRKFQFGSIIEIDWAWSYVVHPSKIRCNNKKGTDDVFQCTTGVKYIVKGVEPVPREQAQAIQKKLEACRNQENNPDSDV